MSGVCMDKEQSFRVRHNIKWTKNEEIRFFNVNREMVGL